MPAERERCLAAVRAAGLAVNRGESLEGAIRNLAQVAVSNRDFIEELEKQGLTDAKVSLFQGGVYLTKRGVIDHPSVVEGKLRGSVYETSGGWFTLRYLPGDPISEALYNSRF